MTDVTTIKVQGQTVWFEALTDEQVDDALAHMPSTQQRILGLAGRGLGNKEICEHLHIKASTLVAYKKHSSSMTASTLWPSSMQRLPQRR